MKELSIYLESALINQPLEHVLKQSITSYVWQADSLKPWVSVVPILKYSNEDSVLESKVHVKLEDSSQFGLKPSNIKLHDLTQTHRLNRQDQENVGWHDFELTSILGKGGMGIVYEGFQNSLKRVVALKQSKSEHKYLAQIYHEAQITAFLDHPNILPVYDFAIDQDRNPIQVMKKINGVNWSKLLQDENHPVVI